MNVVTMKQRDVNVEVTDLFSPLKLRGVTLRNRVALSPMVQTSSVDGMPTEWHLVHLGGRASSGVGLVMTEATAVSAEGRITAADLGLWSSEHASGHAKIAGFIRGQGAVAGVQLGHSGRKGSMSLPYSRDGLAPLRWLEEGEGGWPVCGPSPIAFGPGAPVPKEMTLRNIESVLQDYERSADHAVSAGYQWIEIHAAHGYLPHCFYSPLSNARRDCYGGDVVGRTRFLRELMARLRQRLPAEIVLAARISYTDWIPGGWTLEESVYLAGELKAIGVDLLDVSSGGNSPDTVAVMKDLPRESHPPEVDNEGLISVYEGYQVAAAAHIRTQVGMPVACVGMIESPEFANGVVVEGKADLVMLGRALLRDPLWVARAALALGKCAQVELAPQYYLGWKSEGAFGYAFEGGSFEGGSLGGDSFESKPFRLL